MPPVCKVKVVKGDKNEITEIVGQAVCQHQCPMSWCLHTIDIEIGTPIGCMH